MTKKKEGPFKLRTVEMPDAKDKGLAIECGCGSYSRWRSGCGRCGKKYPKKLMRTREFVNRAVTGKPDLPRGWA